MRLFGCIFHGFTLLSARFARDNEANVTELAGRWQLGARQRTDRMQEEWGLRERLGFQLMRPSGGEQRRVETWLSVDLICGSAGRRTGFLAGPRRFLPVDGAATAGAA